jgi:putative salt-induced outer membrane protein YdiY
MRSFRSISTTVLSSCILFGTSGMARAQDLPQGTAAQAPATKGSTEVTAQKFESVAANSDPEKAKDATDLSIGAGGLLSTGNARLLALTANSQFRLRRVDNQFTAAAAGNYSRTAATGKPLETTVQNLQGKTRYDRFFLVDWTAFLGVQARNDKFQGLDLRLQIDPGIGYYFVNDAKHLFWGEIGYDYLHDIRREDDRVVRDAAGLPTGQILDKTSSVHSGRLFLGYDNQLNEAVTFTMGLEFLQGLSSTSTRRFNGDAKLSSKLGAGFSLATTFALRYDNEPLPGKENVDTITALNLVFKLL